MSVRRVETPLTCDDGGDAQLWTPAPDAERTGINPGVGDTPLKLFALWTFMLFNIVFRDLHQFAMKPFLEMLLTGRYDGVEITERLMLLGAVLAEVPIAMALLSVLLNPAACRGATAFALPVTTATLLSSAPRDLDDGFHLALALAALAAIGWTAWAWKTKTRGAA
jgi:hypothetical protein